MKRLDVAASFSKRIGSAIATNNGPAPLLSGRQSIILTLDDIEDEDWNPRLTENDEYDNIKCSIRSRLLDAPISVTKRPGDNKYIRRAGGKTRYKILRELYQETGDDKYYRLEFNFYPWIDEIDVVAGHATENLLRAGLNFYEQAYQEKHFRTVITKQNPDFVDASVRGRAERYAQHGYIVTTAYLSMFDFIHARLLPYLENHLLAGLGYRQLSQIRSLQKEYQPVYDYHSSTTGGDEWFTSVLEQYSKVAATHDIELFRNTIIQHLSAHFQIVPNRLASTQPQPQPSRPTSANEGQSSSANLEKGIQSADSESDSGSVNASPQDFSADKGHSSDVEFDSNPNHEPGRSEQRPPVDSEEQRLLIREKASEIALLLAAEYGLLEGCVSSGQDVGLGYSLDHPDTIDIGTQSNPVDTLFIYHELHALAYAAFEHDRARIHSGPMVEKIQSLLSSPSISEISNSASFRKVSADQLWWRRQYHLIHAHIVDDHQRTSAILIEQLGELSQLACRYVSVEK